MRWRLLCSTGLGVLVGAVLFAPPAWGQVTLEEHAGYSPVTDYNVTWNELDEPWIYILQPSNAELGPYDFSCYLTEGEESRPWNIAGISAGESLQGNVELMVRSSWLLAGAANVWRLDVEREDVDLTLKEFVICRELGDLLDPCDPDIYVTDIDGTFDAMGLGSPLHVQYLTGDFTLVYNDADIEVTQPVTHNANVEIQNFIVYDRPHNLTIAGSLAGDLTLGDPGYYG